MIKVKRVYEPFEVQDGPRFLVDRLWPRGRSKDSLRIQAWLKEVAPTNELRKWYGHDPAKWEEFRRRYWRELDEHQEAWQPLVEADREGDVTLLFSTRELVYNNAVALKAYLERHRSG